MENKRENKKVSGVKSAGMWIVLALISIASFSITYFVISGGHPEQRGQEDSYSTCMSFLVIILSCFSLAAGVIGYMIVLVTRCFTFNFKVPVWNSSLKARLFIVNIIVTTAILLGAAGLAAGIAGPMLSLAFGFPGGVSSMIPFFIVFLPGQLFLTFLNIWNPLFRSLIGERMRAKDLSNDEIAAGHYAGISDPAGSSMKKFSFVEDDIGMLFIKPDSIHYSGDRRDFGISHSQELQIERVADQGSIAAYAGAVHIILSWLDEGGEQQTVRLHLEDYWTLQSLSKKFDDFAHKLNEWKHISGEC